MKIEMMRVASRRVAVSVLAVGLLLGASGRARGGPLNPLDFASLGAFPTVETGGTFYTIDTSGTPTLTGPGGTTITGVVYNGIAVFDFDSIKLGGPNSSGPGQVFTVTGSLPLALLSRTDATIAGTINASSPYFYIPGPGGGSGGYGAVLLAAPVAAALAKSAWERAAEAAEASEVMAVPEPVWAAFPAAMVRPVR